MHDDLPKGISALGAKFRVRVGSGKRRLSRVCGTLDEAVSLRRSFLQDIASGAMAFAGGMTVADWGRVWLPRRRARASYGNDCQRWRTHILPAFGRRPLAAVTRRDVKAWLRALEGKRAASTARNCKSLLSVAFRDAVEDEVTPHNPCDGVRLETQLARISEDWFLFPDEQAALLARAGGELRAMLGVAIGAGLRRGELFALHVRDVHLDEASPHLMVRYGGFAKGGKLKAPKNGKARRVALFGLALETLGTWLGQVPPNDHGLVFPTPSGARRVYSRDLPAEWRGARAAVSRIKPWWHLLRHTCASSLIAGWWGPAWSLEEVSKFLGHSSIAVTERYAHLAPSRLDERAATMPVVTVATDISTKRPKLHAIARSRPGDLNEGPDSGNLGKSLPDGHPMATEVLEALRAIAAGDPTALARATSVLGELLPHAARAELRGTA